MGPEPQVILQYIIIIIINKTTTIWIFYSPRNCSNFLQHIVWCGLFSTLTEILTSVVLLRRFFFDRFASNGREVRFGQEGAQGHKNGISFVSLENVAKK